MTLPPTIKEVRGPGAEESEPRYNVNATPTYNPAPTFNAVSAQSPAPTPAPVSNQDVLLVPRWVYVPYSPHVPSGPTKLPANMNGLTATNPYVQTDDRMTVLPPMGVAPTAVPNQALVMEQCLQQMKLLNQRMVELESRNATRPATAISIPVPQMPTAPVITAPPVVIPPVPAPTFAGPPQMLPLPPPLAKPMIPPAK